MFEKPRGVFPVVPLMGFPGTRLTKTTIRENLEDAEMHFESLKALYLKYRPDAMLTMMDLSIEAEALGISVIKPEDASYTVKEHPIRTREELKGLKVPDPLKDGRLPLYLEVVRKMKASFDCYSMAYVIGPYTLAGLLNGATNVVKNVLKNPEFLTELLDFCTKVVSVYGRELIRAGADAIVILEPTATVLSPKQFNMYSGKYVSEIIKSWDKTPVILHICGDTTHLIPDMLKTGCAGISLDSMVNFADVVKKIPAEILLIGNTDPVNYIALGTKEELIAEVKRLLSSMAGKKNFVLSSGCDLPPETSHENLELFVEMAKNFSH